MTPYIAGVQWNKSLQRLRMFI